MMKLAHMIPSTSFDIRFFTLNQWLENQWIWSTALQCAFRVLQKITKLNLMVLAVPLSSEYYKPKLKLSRSFLLVSSLMAVALVKLPQIVLNDFWCTQ
ncbi:hypothetical protein AN191_16565 [Loktanella sp. 5RATIMAR09]|nr:hypothetical protein AN191_16565 [Loktanella sp. 5RATIMAR09]